MSEAGNADLQIPPEIIRPETRLRDDVFERGLLIGGNSVPASSGKLADDVSPWDGEIYARVAAGTPEDITRAADAAQAAFPTWSRMGAFERREIFLKAADVMAERGEEAIVALARETGASRLFSEFNLAFASRCCARRRRRRSPVRWVSCCRPRSRVPTRWPSESRSAWWGRSHRGTRRSSSASDPSPFRWQLATPW
jgi:hypothetical protein